MALKSLKISAKEAKKQNEPVAVGNEDRYPWGTRLDLNKDSLDKLGIKDLPAVGTKMMIEAKVTVIATRQTAREDDTTRSLELQITDMAIENDGDEVAEKELTRGESKAMSAVAKKIQGM